MNRSSAAPWWPLLPRERCSLATASWSALTGLGLTVPACYLTWFLLLPWAAHLPTDPALADRLARAMVSPWPILLKAVLIYPAIEEIFYRGWVFGLLRRILLLGWAVAIPSTLFGLTHVGGGLPNVLFAGWVGRYLHWLLLRTGSIVPCILCHAAINFGVLLIFNPILLASGRYSGPQDMAGPLPLALLAGSVVFAAWTLSRLCHATMNGKRATAAVAAPLVPSP